MSLIGIIASQNYPRIVPITVDYLVVAGGAGGGVGAGGGGGGGATLFPTPRQSGRSRS